MHHSMKQGLLTEIEYRSLSIKKNISLLFLLLLLIINSIAGNAFASDEARKSHYDNNKEKAILLFDSEFEVYRINNKRNEPVFTFYPVEGERHYKLGNGGYGAFFKVSNKEYVLEYKEENKNKIKYRFFEPIWLNIEMGLPNPDKRKYRDLISYAISYLSGMDHESTQFAAIRKKLSRKKTDEFFKKPSNIIDNNLGDLFVDAITSYEAGNNTIMYFQKTSSYTKRNRIAMNNAESVNSLFLKDCSFKNFLVNNSEGLSRYNGSGLAFLSRMSRDNGRCRISSLGTSVWLKIVTIKDIECSKGPSGACFSEIGFLCESHSEFGSVGLANDGLLCGIFRNTNFVAKITFKTGDDGIKSYQDIVFAK